MGWAQRTYDAWRVFCRPAKAYTASIVHGGCGVRSQTQTFWGEASGSSRKAQEVAAGVLLGVSRE